MTDRIQALRNMLVRNPADTRAHFGLAAELEKTADWNGVVEHLNLYLAHADDQGNAWGRLAKALLALDRRQEAAVAYRRGIDAASSHGHPSMAAEFEDALEQLED